MAMTAYVDKVLRDEAEGLRAVAVPGNRNKPYSKVVYKVFQFVAGGALDDAWAENWLLALADEITLSRREAASWIKSYRRKAADKPRDAYGNRAVKEGSQWR